MQVPSSSESAPAPPPHTHTQLTWGALIKTAPELEKQLDIVTWAEGVAPTGGLPKAPV